MQQQKYIEIKKIRHPSMPGMGFAFTASVFIFRKRLPVAFPVPFHRVSCRFRPTPAGNSRTALTFLASSSVVPVRCQSISFSIQA